MSKMQGLQQALSNSATGKAKLETRVLVKASNDMAKTATVTKSPSREGKELIGAWLNPDFKKSLRLAQMRKGGKVYLDDLVAEALNDLFVKYDVPIVQHE